MTSVVVGRASESQAIEEALSQAVEGLSTCLLFQGESGIGKSALLELAAGKAEEQGALVLRGESWDSESTPAYWPWVRVAEQLIHHMGTEALLAAAGDEVGPLIGMVPSLGGHTQGRSVAGRTSPFDLASPLAAVLRKVGERRPVVLIFDDLHAADEASVELLHLLVTSMRKDNVVFMAAYREGRGHPSEKIFRLASHAERHVLKGLDVSEVAQFYQVTTGNTCSDELASELLEASAGQPLYLREVIISLSDGSLNRPDHSVGFRVPGGLKILLRTRLEDLHEEVLQVLATASVIGRRFDISLLGEVFPLKSPPLLALVDQAVASGVLVESGAHGEYEFTQVMLRELVYEELRSSDRMKLHAVVAQALENRYGGLHDNHLAEIAHHYFKAAQAGDQKKSLEYLIRAGDEARSRGALREAIRNYSRGLKVAELAGSSRAKRDSIKKILAELKDEDTVVVKDDQGGRAEGHEIFKRTGDFWTLSYEGQVLRLKDSKGLRYLYQLLQAPGRELHVLEMAALAAGTDPEQRGRRTGHETGLQGSGGGVGEAILDARAKEEFRKRLGDLQEEIEDAESLNDPERASRARAEMEQLTEALAAAMGLGGRDKTISLEAERARVSVSKALRIALNKIDSHDPALGAHLTATVRTGYYCSYVPDPRSALRWELAG